MTRFVQHPVRLVLAASLALLALAACRPGGDGRSTAPSNGQGGAVAGDAAGLTAAVEVTELVVGRGTVTVTVRDGEAPVSGATVEVQGDMTHAGMTPVIAGAVEAEPGVYRTDGFAFTMAGDWIVTAEVSTPDGREVTAEAFVTVSR